MARYRNRACASGSENAYKFGLEKAGREVTCEKHKGGLCYSEHKIM
jgi:hypothetical protein